jgi:hypothetical protein
VMVVDIPLSFSPSHGLGGLSKQRRMPQITRFFGSHAQDNDAILEMDRSGV